MKLPIAALGAVLVLGTSSFALGQSVLDEAKKTVAERSGPQTVWDGPTEGPKPEPGKKIAYLSTDEQNDAAREWGQAVKEAGELVGWEVTIIDGRGSPKTWIEGFNQAIALQVDGVVTTADIASLQEPVQTAREQGIIVLGIHGLAFPGPDEKMGVFYNIQQDPRDIGRAQADWIIADSDGKGRVVVTTHCEYAIACAKGEATRDRILECEECEMLEFSNTPIAEAAQRQPQLVTAWVQQYGTPLYITSVADYTADFQVPALRAGGVDPAEVTIVSADGNRSAYERIRAGGEYQRVTASEPYELQGFQAIDEFNRAFHGEPPSGWVQKPYLVTVDNIDAEGGDQNGFRPSMDYKGAYKKIWGIE